jgi:hypothetical protein
VSNCHLIIDGRPQTGPEESHGLPHAVPYFEEFPVMPSPSNKGALQTSSNDRTVMRNTSLEAVLDAIIAHVRTHGTVLLVCHADEDGLYMRIATGAAFARAVVLGDLRKIVDSIKIIGRPASAQNIPDNWLADKSHDDWKKLQGRWPFTTVVPATAAEARQYFMDSLRNAARTWRLGGWRGPVRLAVKILDVQDKRLDRLELRACWIGSSRDTSKKVKDLFRCAEFVAPEELNFFMELPIGRRLLRGIPGRRGSARQPGPLNPAAEQQMAEAALRGRNTRMFRNYTYVVGRYRWGTLLHNPFPNWPAIAVTVNRLRSTFRFSGHAYVCTPAQATDSRYEDRAIVRWFIEQYIQPKGGTPWLARHATGRLAIPFHGFWTPEQNDVFVLPGESSYLRRIKCF